MERVLQCVAVQACELLMSKLCYAPLLSFHCGRGDSQRRFLNGSQACGGHAVSPALHDDGTLGRMRAEDVSHH